MSRIIEEELKAMSNEELSNLTINHGVYLYMYDGTMNEVRIKDLVGTDVFMAKLIDYTGLSFFRQSIKRIEIM